MVQADDIFKKIGYILNDLQDQQEYFEHHPDRINAPELELFLANANFLADHVKIYVRLKASEELQREEQAPVAQAAEDHSIVVPQTEAGPEEQKEEIAAAAMAEEAESRIDLQPAETVLPFEEAEVFKPDASPAPFEFVIDQQPASDKFDFEEQPVEQLFDRPLSEAEQQVINSKKDALNKVVEEDDDEIGPEPFLIAVEEEPIIEEAPIVEEKPIVAKVNVAPPVVEAPAPLPVPVQEKPALQENQVRPTLNDMLARNSGASSAAHVRKVADLKQAISLNDKLLFIKDLFNGYNLAYAEAVDLINKMSDFASADAFLQKNYAEKNGWADKPNTVSRFYALLEQRFAE